MMTRQTIHSLRWWASGAASMLKRHAVMPFETAFALMSIWSGLAGLFDWSLQSKTFNVSVNADLAMGFNVVYIVAGVSIFCGLGWAYRNLEAFGLILLFMSLVVRVVTTAALVGIFYPVVIGLVAQALFFCPACMWRFYSLWKGEIVITTQAIVTSPKELAELDKT